MPQLPLLDCRRHVTLVSAVEHAKELRATLAIVKVISQTVGDDK